MWSKLPHRSVIIFGKKMKYDCHVHTWNSGWVSRVWFCGGYESEQIVKWKWKVKIYPRGGWISVGLWRWKGSTVALCSDLETWAINFDMHGKKWKRWLLLTERVFSQHAVMSSRFYGFLVRFTVLHAEGGKKRNGVTVAVGIPKAQGETLVV